MAGDIAGAGAAMAGLLLVFIGATAVGFDSFSAEAKHAVRNAFLRRGWLALIGFFLALAAAAAALLGKYLAVGCLVGFAGTSLAGSFLLAAVAAYLTIQDLH